MTYSHFPILYNPKSHKVIPFIDYGIIEKYWHQDFDFIKIISDSNEQLCLSPFKSAETQKNIIKIFNKLKIRINNNRKSPSNSATFYKKESYKIGLNNSI